MNYLKGKLSFEFYKLKNKLSAFKIHYVFSLLMTIIIFQWFWYQNSWWTLGFLFLIIPLNYYLNIKWRLGIILFLFAVILAFGLSQIKIEKSQSVFKLIFKQNLLHLKLTQLVQKKYFSNLANFINLLIFNDRKINNNIYTSLKSLSVLHLIVVSGLHLGVIHKLITKIFYKKYQIGHWLSFIFLIIYWSIIDFSYSGFRVLLSIYIFNKKTKIWFNNWTKVTIASLFFYPQVYVLFSFLLSSGVVFLIQWIKSWNLSTKLHEWLAINIFIWIYVTILLINWTKRFYYFLLLNTYILTPIIIFLYFYFFIFWFWFFLLSIHQFIFNLFNDLLDLLIINKFYYFFDSWKSYYSEIFLLTMFTLFFFGYFYKKNKEKMI